MNKKIVEILSILLQKMLKDNDVWQNKEELIIELEDQGYTIEDIHQAYEIVLSEEINYNNIDFYTEKNRLSGYNRVFTKLESFYLNRDAKSIIYKLNSLGVLTADELEAIIFNMIHLASVDDLRIETIWSVINNTVDKLESIVTISNNIEEFNENLLKQKIVN